MKLTPGTQTLAEGAEKPEGTTEEERWLRCAACGARIAPERARIEINHLGWSFHAADPRDGAPPFHGLVRDRLA